MTKGEWTLVISAALVLVFGIAWVLYSEPITCAPGSVAWRGACFRTR